ncbi:MAG TPA: hypothetical protein VFM71_08055 [Gemmatimonadaceae bacterium]|nr:hypothetical protein [Gemmatimonadaceae bacterium]
MSDARGRLPVTKASQSSARTPWRALDAERRVAILTRLFTEQKDARTLYAQRLTQRGGGFRMATLLGWPVDKLAREVVRLNAPTADDEADLLHALYVELEPDIQRDFLEAAGVKHEGAVIDESATAPYTDAESVRRAAALVREKHGASAEHYLRTIARYNADAWPDIATVIQR